MLGRAARLSGLGRPRLSTARFACKAGSPMERLAMAGLEPVVIAEHNGASVYLVNDLLPGPVADGLFAELATDTHWRRESDDFGLQDRTSAYWAE